MRRPGSPSADELCDTLKFGGPAPDGGEVTEAETEASIAADESAAGEQAEAVAAEAPAAETPVADVDPTETENPSGD